MYNVIVNGKSVSVTSYAAARTAVRDLANDFATNLRASADFNKLRSIFRSSKTATNEVRARTAQAANIENAKLTMPKTASNCNGELASLVWTVSKAA